MDAAIQVESMIPSLPRRIGGGTYRPLRRLFHFLYYPLPKFVAGYERINAEPKRSFCRIHS